MKMRDYRKEGKSENYQDAEDKGLLKAGAVAALLTKKFNTKISAKELECFASEWHHAGVFKGRGRRVYFFRPAEVERITLAQITDRRARELAKPAPDVTLVQGWYVQFFKMTDPVTRRTFSKPFVGIYKGPRHKAPKGFQVLNDEAFARAEAKRGQALQPGEQPLF